MTHNDVLRRIRYIFDLNDNHMIEVFACADHTVTREQVCAWLKQEADPGYEEITDKQMAIFLNGLINARRGRRDDPQPAPEGNLTNNMILMKLRIALNLQSDDILTLLEEMLLVKLQVVVVLVEVARREHRRQHRHLRVQLHAHQAVDHGRRDELMAVDAAIDYQGAGDHGVVEATACELLRVQGNLEGAGDLEEVDLVTRPATSLEVVEQALARLADDVGVPGSAQDGHPRRPGRYSG